MKRISILIVLLIVSIYPVAAQKTPAKVARLSG